MKNINTLILALIFGTCLLFGYLLDKQNKKIEFNQNLYEIKDKELQNTLDSLLHVERVIIERHTHINNKYNENHYTIISANDSTTKNSLFANLERYEYLHNTPPSKNHKSNR
jgi:hypothetical protein